MRTDRYDLEVTTSSDVALAHYVEAIDRMLAGDPGVDEELAAAVEADEGLALAHAATARQHQLNARGLEARDAAEHACALAEGSSRREQQHVEIIRRLVTGDVPGALDLTREHIVDYPRDAFALSPSTGVFGAIGFSGRIDREPEMLALLEPLADAYGDDWWFLTAHAFALLETGSWVQARELTERSLEIRPTNPHGAHTLAHALYEAGEDETATSFMGEFLETFDRGSLMHCHNWWHYAILLVGAGRIDEAWAVWSENCAPGHSGSPSINIFSDSSSFLWRAELAGAARDEAAWQSVLDYYEENFRRPIVFVDAHAGLAYAALGRTEELESVIDQLQELGEAGRLPAGTTAATLSRAYAAFADERWSDVIDTLEPVMDQVVRIGGSRAQRDLITNTLLVAYLNADRPEDAGAMLAGVTDRQPSRPVRGHSDLPRL